MISVCRSGKNPTMRCLKRCHNVCIAWLHERFTSDLGLKLTHQPTRGQSANILTKALDRVSWERERAMIGVCPPGGLPNPLSDVATLCSALVRTRRPRVSFKQYPSGAGGNTGTSGAWVARVPPGGNTGGTVGHHNVH